MKAWFLFVGLAGSAIAAGQPPPAVPRAPDGKPSLQGIWRVQNTADWDIQDHSPALGIPPGAGIVVGNEIPYQPWAAEKKKENFKKRATADPNSKCFLPGVPRVMYLPFPLQILQTPKYVVIASEYVHADRIIPLDGSAHPEDIDFWMGDSRGHWEGDTLVVDVRNFNDQTWFDRAGNFHSAELHVVERYNRTGPDTLRYEATIEDPKVFTRPWKIATTLYRDTDKNAQILEYDCFAYREPAGGAK
ncbi:MAG TPA: hypothetical protein VJ732_08840 [Bryobacteraceae bacterium]|nr:hypothetical protein [Bryobacteraceae bacterium]